MRTLTTSTLAATGLLFTIAASEAGPVAYLATGGNADCSTRQQSCGTLTTAIANVDEGGEIICIDTGPFTVNTGFQKSFSLNCPGAVLNVTYFEVNAIDQNQTVKLTGVTLNAKTSGSQPALKINGGHVILENCTIRNSANFGIDILAFASPARVTLIDTVVTKNVQGNIRARPTGSNPIWLTLDRTTLTNSVYGVRAEGNTSGRISVEAHASVAAHHSGNGFIAVSNTGQGEARFKITKSVAHDNAAFGAVATGAQAFMIVSDSALTENGTGLAQLNGATVATYANNDVNFNTTNTAGTITTIARR